MTVEDDIVEPCANPSCAADVVLTTKMQLGLDPVLCSRCEDINDRMAERDQKMRRFGPWRSPR